MQGVWQVLPGASLLDVLRPTLQMLYPCNLQELQQQLDAATQELSKSKEKAKELLQCNADLQQQVDRLQTELEAAVQEREVRELWVQSHSWCEPTITA
jgi:ElaB/YqjD/DUF883 family membrane-anchored ribosome-binding protein